MKPVGKVIWITGGSSGIGAALADELARRGARVAITARREQKLAEVASRARGDVRAYPGDVRDRDEMIRIGAAVESEVGPIDLAVLNAGIWEQMDVARWDSTSIREHIATNLLGMVNGLDAVLPAMIARRSGGILGVASVAGYRGYTRAEAYGTTKAAAINLLESLRVDLDRLGVNVQVVNPGFVRTELTERNDFPMPFMIEADDAARRIADAIEKEKAEAVFPLPYRIGMKLVRFAPVRPYTAASRWFARRSEAGTDSG
ncbi:MAG TPA: SDR family NAD(P)-dependent oxidoreductase [Candidatus Limnocylindrales bacterium]|nr:SDR family NAD(P)-dependent oxidoreductase [Candidatus Limnocylindrales bacterium]